MHFRPASASLDAASIAEVLQFLRSHTSAVLLIDGEARACKIVPDPLTGAPVSAAEPWILEAAAFTLCIPDDSPGGLQLIVQPETLDPRSSPAADRYLAYHGENRSARLVRWIIEAGKGGGNVFEGPVLMVPNPLAATEFSLLKNINAQPVLFAGAVQKILSKVWADPRAVGIDPWGIDVHSRFGMTRINFAAPVSNETASAAVSDLLAIAPR